MSQTESEDLVEEGTATFSSDSKLLSEIGERLIATPDIALAELIKNAYDADATKCNIWLEEDGDVLIVKDDGHGMTKDEFLDYWMTVATTSRLEQETSKKYNRELTGAKGVGRFAVRNLGLQLELSTVAYYEEHNEYRRLTAKFEWADFESGEALQDENVEYEIERTTSDEEGTELRISDLQVSWSQEEIEDVSGEVLDIISAPYESNRSEMDIDDGEVETADPGFSVYFAPPGEGSPTKSAAQEIYERYVARVEINIEDGKLFYECEYPYGYDDGEAGERTYEFDLDENLVGDIRGEIRYFNQDYSGLFRGMDTVDGRSVPKWLRENGGVRVIDKNFRMPPYGDQGNDWLNISESHARREREWRSSFVADLFPGDDLSNQEIRERQLNLPRKNQVLGSIHVSSHRPEDAGVDRESINHLVPAMDRQGFVQNEAMDQLVDVSRGAIEIIGILDKEEELRRKEEDAEEASTELQKEIEEKKNQAEEEIDSVVDDLSNTTSDGRSTSGSTNSAGSSTSTETDLDSFVSGSGGSTVDTGSSSGGSTTDNTSSVDAKVRERLNREVKPEITESYEELEKKVEQFEQAQEDLRTSVESMYLMSSVAAFMTHETSELLRNANEMIEAWEAIPEEERDEEFERRLEKTKEAKSKFNKQLGYAKRFMSGLDEETESELYVNGKIDEVVEQFDHYTQERDIQIERDVPKYLQTPELNPSIYTGVIMNLFTNAIKAVLEVSPDDSGRVIRFDGENTGDWHILRVADTGSGIPEGIEERIFDPLFSTTDRPDDDPLGGGVGLGLYVVERVVERLDGEISVVEPPEGFETCFEVKFER